MRRCDDETMRRCDPRSYRPHRILQCGIPLSGSQRTVTRSMDILHDPAVRAALVERLNRLTPTSAAAVGQDDRGPDALASERGIRDGIGPATGPQDEGADPALPPPVARFQRALAQGEGPDPSRTSRRGPATTLPRSGHGSFASWRRSPRGRSREPGPTATRWVPCRGRIGAAWECCTWTTTSNSSASDRLTD